MDSAAKLTPLVVIVGETASGKSDLALDLAQKFNGEIICADSWTVRRKLDIGTAKPSKEDRARIPHHLLDVAEPCADFTAAVFQKLANKAISDISRRGKLPIMVGGTGLYIDGVIFDFSFLPEATKTLRHELDELTREQLLDRIKLSGLSLDDIDTRNKRRLVRLLETEGARPTKQTIRPNTVILGIKLPRETLKARIEARVQKQIEKGLEQEVMQLADEYGWDCEALKGIGYREWREYFAGTQRLDQTKDRIIRSTLNLAKRQRTWFKRNRGIHWLKRPDEAVDRITTLLNK